jgi:hypothetical protein
VTSGSVVGDLRRSLRRLVKEWDDFCWIEQYNGRLVMPSKPILGFSWGVDQLWVKIAKFYSSLPTKLGFFPSRNGVLTNNRTKIREINVVSNELWEWIHSTNMYQQ